MSHFTDAAGRVWTLAFDLPRIDMIRDRIGIDLLSLFDPPPEAAINEGARPRTALERLSTEPRLLVDVLWMAIEDEAARADVSRGAWLQGLGGDVLSAAADALLAGVIDFFPCGQREQKRRALAAMQTLEARIAERGLARLETVPDSPHLARLIDQTLDETLARLAARKSGGSPASPAVGRMD